MLTIENLEKELNSNSLRSLYLLYGEELFLLENILKKIKNIFGECIKGINYINIDDTNISELISDIETPAFGYEKKLLIVRNSGILKKEGKRKNAELSNLREKISSYIKENIDIINDSVVLVIIEEDIDNKQELYKIFDKFGVVCNFEYQKPMQIQKRLKAICNAYHVDIDDSSLKYFIEVCGTNMQELINEIRKLIEYAGNGGKIEKVDIDKLCIKKLETIIFDLTDNLGKKETQKALQVLKNLIANKEPIQKILITLYNHFKKLYITKLAVRENKDLISSLNLKPNQTFLVNKYKTQANYFSGKELSKILQGLRDLDYNSKNGLIDLQVGLEAILCTYCS
ncbi:MAG: DNA polymerase III subunit delta [Clostridia bacterium]|nr:DNA polymerase III subunit delta [Clostridium sp.]